MTSAPGVRRGRPATATREDVLRAARAQFAAGLRLDVTVIARELGLGRATIYRWFGSREHLLADAVATELEVLVARARREVTQRGPVGLLLGGGGR